MRIGSKRALLFGLALTAASSIHGLRPMSASAYSSTCTSNGGVHSNYFDGYQTDPNNEPEPYEGVSAWITERDSPLCSANSTEAPYNFSTAWVMVQGNGHVSGGDGEYIQSGYINYQTRGCSSEWTQKRPNIGTMFQEKFGACITTGTTQRFWIAWDPAVVGGPGFDANVGSQTFDSIPATTFATPFQIDYYSEASFLQDDIPGYSTAQTTFGGPILIQERNTANSFINTPCILNWNNNGAAPGSSNDTSTNPSGTWAHSAAANCAALGYSNQFLSWSI